MGANVLDVVSYVAEFPRVSETVLSESMQVDFGGKGANQAVQARRMGANVAYLGCVGCDAFGQDTLRHLRAQGIDLRGLQRSRTVSNGLSAVTVRNGGDNMIVFGAGANAEVNAGNVQSGCEAVFEGCGAAVVLGQLEIDIAATAYVFERAKSLLGSSAINMLNIAPFPDETKEAFTRLLHKTDVVCCNSLELQEFTRGARLGDLCEKFGIGLVVETRGSEGYRLYDADGEEAICGASSPLVSPEDVVDTVGAGDSFIGTLAARYLAGKTWQEAAYWASIAAGESVMIRGTQKAFPTAAHVDFLMNSRQLTDLDTVAKPSEEKHAQSVV